MIKGWLVKGLLAGVSLAALPQMAGAQEIRDLDRESSNVRSFPGQLVDGQAFFETTVAQGTALQIDVIATSELDSMLTVTDAGTGEVIAEDDDSGGDLNPRVLIPGEDGRRIRIEVHPFNYDGGDNTFDYTPTFDLRLTTMEHRVQPSRAIAFGGAMGGTLLNGDRHEFTFTGQPGKLLEAAMLAGEGANLDPFLELHDASGETVASNDDSGGNLNALLRYVMKDEGPYTLIASSVGGGSGGEYTLRLAQPREAQVQAPLQVIGFGDEAGGRIGGGYENGDIDPASIDYQLSPAAIEAILAGGGQITIHMDAVEGKDEGLGEGVSNSLDPFLEIGFDTPLGFATVDSDDDGSGTLNAMLPIDLSSLKASRDLLERLRIRAKAFGGMGAYVLRVTEGMEARPEAAEGEYPPPVIAPAYD